MFSTTGNESKLSTNTTNSTTTSSSISTATSPSFVQRSQPCRHFKFGEIISATKNFDESLVTGRGGFGKVYKGNINNGSTLVVAAIKRLDVMSRQGASEFWAEVEMLSKLRHCHLVSLIGYCNYEMEMILVYEYMSRGTLEDHLHKLGTHVSWSQRLKICIGAARGLDYLHTGTGIEYGVIHRDVKSSNILLDESWASKVSDFGLSKITPRNQPSTYVSTLIKGTFGYIDPNYFATGKLTRKSDVYAFGVVLLEVLCRKRAVDNSFEFGIAKWAQDSIKEGGLKNIVDYDIRDEISPNCLNQFAQVVESCLDNHPKHRPTMAEVVLSLEYVLTLQEKMDNELQSATKTMFSRIVHKFSFDHISENMILGRGGYGIVYKGILPGNRMIAVKKCKVSELKVEQFINEIVTLGEINHMNLVKLLGCCLETEIPLLIYNFVSNFSLHYHIHNSTITARRLSWDRRLRIAHESASALAYLHVDAPTTIIHGNMKSTNILLDENYTAKVADFGIAKLVPLGHDQVSTITTGALGYLDPEYLHTDKLTDKSDVYSFGVVLAELLTGLSPVTSERREEDKNLATYFLKAKSENQLPQIVDHHVLEEATEEQLEGVCCLACRCLDRQGDSRPSMKEVTMELEKIRNFNIVPIVSQDKDNETI